MKKKRGRKPKSELKVNENEIEYEYLPTINNQQFSFTQINIPPLSNFELKQIVEGLINHNQEKTLTFDEAQSFAINKAIEIGKIQFSYYLESEGKSENLKTTSHNVRVR